ncbi:MAG: L-fucose dehydrogenase [Pirellulaceae bacterium]|nr:MAG: L-fucose dehydrogenase [Pirellulaceae bacterium]
MELRRFGRIGLQVPKLVFGATSLGNLFRAVPHEEKAALVEAWTRVDWRPLVIDSAGKYGAGMSLQTIGEQLQRLAVPPEEVLISNKLGWRQVPLAGPQQSFEPDAWFELTHDAVLDISYDGILRCWEQGNRLMGGYTAALVSVHDPDEYLRQADTPEMRRRLRQHIVDAYRALVELRDAGQAKAVGMGAKDWRTIKELADDCDLDWIMLANSFTVMKHPAELAEFMHDLARRGVAIINSALFHGGFLLGGELFDYRRLDAANPSDRQLLEWRRRFSECCHRLGYSPFDVGVAFGLSHPAVTSVALSSSRADRLADHVAAVNQRIEPSVWREFMRAGLIAEHCDFLGC